MITPGTTPSGPYPIPRIIAFANIKGGVGKTTTTINLGACLAEQGYRVLIIDLDPQGNATSWLGAKDNHPATMYHVLTKETPLEDCLVSTATKNLFVVPSDLNLAGAEIELVSAYSRETRLKAAISQIIDQFDYVLIDCPPSVSLLTVNALTAANEVIAPLQSHYSSLEGLKLLWQNILKVKEHLNPGLDITHIIITMFDARTKHASEVESDIRENSEFGPKVCKTNIPHNVRLTEATSFGQPITIFDSNSAGAKAYRAVALEVSGGAKNGTR